jgi:hypothetical protein
MDADVAAQRKKWQGGPAGSAIAMHASRKVLLAAQA